MYHRRLHEQSLRVPVVQYGCTPLSWATQANSFAIAELLIEKGTRYGKIQFLFCVRYLTSR